MKPYYQRNGVTLYLGDNRDVLEKVPDLIDACITDPPYGLSFMGKKWDYDVPGFDTWGKVFSLLKPGAHLLSFFGTRTYHRGVVNIEDAGFEIRDQIGWLYGSGFPKSLDVSKAIDKRGGAKVAWFGPWLRKWRAAKGITQKQVAALFPSKTGGQTGCVANWELGFNMPTPEQFNLICQTFGLPFSSMQEAEREVIGQAKTSLLAVAPGQGMDRSRVDLDITAPATEAARQWNGWGTALKPAWEPIVLARKPLIGTVAENVQKWGAGAINIDGCRIETDEMLGRPQSTKEQPTWKGLAANGWNDNSTGKGRFPANIIHDGSDEVVGMFPETGVSSGGRIGNAGGGNVENLPTGQFEKGDPGFGDSGSAARFFYSAKADAEDRGEGNTHPTVKPISLMQYLIRLITQPGGIIIDPFAGSGSTLIAAQRAGFRAVGIEAEEKYCEIIARRLEAEGFDFGQGAS